MNDFEKVLMRPAALWAVAVCLGVAAGGDRLFYHGGIRGGTVLIFTAMAVAFAAGLAAIGRSPGRRRPYLLAVWLLVPVFALAGYLRVFEEDTAGRSEYFLEKGTDARITGTADYISVQPDGYRITLADVTVVAGGSTHQLEKVLATLGTDMLTGPEPGDQITANGRIYPFEAACNPGQFDSDMYYRIRHIRARFTASEAFAATPAKPGISYRFSSVLYHIRTFLTRNIFRIFPENEGAVLNSMLTGDRGMLPREIRDMYSEGGISHILSISSLHVSLIVMGLFRLLLKLTSRLRLSVWITMGVMYSYLILTGASVSTRRAVFMTSILLLGKLLKKGYDLLNSAGVAALVMLLIEPLNIYDPGFRLSFLAVAGIFAAGEVARLWEVRGRIARSLITSTGVWLFTLPAVLESYFCINLLSIPVNIIILPMMSVILPAGYAASVTGASFLAGPVYYILKLYEAICGMEEKLPAARPLTGAPEPASVVAYFAVLAGFLVIISHKPYIRKKKAEEPEKPHGAGTGKRKNPYQEKRRNLYALIILVGCAVLFADSPAPDIFVAVLDVGQGDAIYFESEGESFLMDAGSSNVSEVGKYRVIPFLQYRGVKKLDRIFVSHTDKDHTSAVKELIEAGYPVVGGLVLGTNTDPGCELVLLAKEHGIPVYYAAAGDELASEETDGFRINIVAPEPGAFYSDSNSASLVAEFEKGEFSMLLTGDSGFDSEKLYCENLSLESYTLLKCPHHGSKYSTSAEMLERVDPELAVISCSRTNNYGHPSAETLERLRDAGCGIYVTAESGAVIFEVRDRLKITSCGR